MSRDKNDLPTILKEASYLFGLALGYGCLAIGFVILLNIGIDRLFSYLGTP